jgi:hypothetical protein
MNNVPTGGSSTNFAMNAARAWNRFWFTPSDPTTLGLVRLCCGFLLFYILLGFGYDLEAFLGPDAWLNLAFINELRHEAPVYGPPLTGFEDVKLLKPRNEEEEAYIKKWGIRRDQAAAVGQTKFSIWYHVTDPFWMKLVHRTILLFSFCFAIGFCTRVTSVLTWLGFLSYLNRAPTSLFGMDAMMNITMLYLMLGPSGAALSVDRLIKRYWTTARALREGRALPDLSRPEPLISANVAIRLLQVNLCIIYLMSGLSKLQGASWWTGQAVWGTMANYEFSPMEFRPYMSFLQLITQHRWLYEIIVTGGSYGTLALEISFIYLVWNRRLRWTMISMDVLLHLGIALCMGLVAFSLMMITMVASFIPPSAIRQLLERLGRGHAVAEVALQG